MWAYKYYLDKRVRWLGDSKITDEWESNKDTMTQQELIEFGARLERAHHKREKCDGNH
jgi:hypothetical protein